MNNQTHTTAVTSNRFKNGQVSVKLDKKGTMAKLRSLATFEKWKQIFPDAELVNSLTS